MTPAGSSEWRKMRRAKGAMQAARREVTRRREIIEDGGPYLAKSGGASATFAVLLDRVTRRCEIADSCEYFLDAFYPVVYHFVTE